MKQLRYGYNCQSGINKLLKISTEKILEVGAHLNSPAICSLAYDSTDSQTNSRALRIAAEGGHHKVLDYLLKAAMSHSAWDMDIMRAHTFACGADYNKVSAIAEKGSDPVVTRLLKEVEDHCDKQRKEVWGPTGMSRPRLSVPRGLVVS